VTKTLRRVGPVVAVLAMTLAAAACGGSNNPPNTTESQRPQLSGAVRVDGSSTVAPLSEAAADLYKDVQPGVNVTVGTSGTGAGFEKFCNGETDISDASRPINQKEKDACAAKNITFSEFLMANDALSVVVHPSNTWAKCLTVAQLKKIWDQGSTVTNWNQVDPAFPDKPLGKAQLWGPGTDSGTFDYFTEVINGKAKQSRTEFNPSENDNDLVQGVAADPNAMGYFGFTYYEENQDKLKVVQVDAGDGCVTPSVEAAQNGTYKPLSRPLYVYVNNASKSKPAVVDFVDFYVTDLDKITEEAGFVPLTSAQKTTVTSELAEFKG
jgi:phosphate transport system substrate-binding protein